MSDSDTDHHHQNHDLVVGLSPRSPSPLSSSQNTNNSNGNTVRATVVHAASYELHDDEKTDVATDVKRRAQGFLDTIRQRTNMLRQNLTTQAWLFITNVIVSALTLLGVSGALLFEAFSHQHRTTEVGEDYGLNMCRFERYRVYLTASASYSISDLMIGCVFALWYGFRAVRHEKEALLVVFSLVVLGVVGRAIYFAFVTAYYWVTGLSLMTIQIFLCIGSAGLLIAVAQTWRVGRSFGWRMYTKGVASVADVKRMGRLKTLDAAAKLDLFLTINAFNTFFFFAPDITIRYIGFAFTAITALFLLAIPAMIKRQMLFVAYVFAVVGLVLPAFYMFLLVHIFDKNPNHCFEEQLTECAAASNISQVARNISFTGFPALFNVTGCIDCRNETLASMPDSRLCWTNMMPTEGINITDLAVNDTLRDDFLASCREQSTSRLTSCCSEFGRCELKIQLVDSNAPMAVFVVFCAILTRFATMYYGVQQARMLDVPSVEELIARGSRTVSSALSFQFLGSQSPPSTARIRNNGEEDDGYSNYDEISTGRVRHLEGGEGHHQNQNHHGNGEKEINHHHHNLQSVNMKTISSSPNGSNNNDVPGVNKNTNTNHHKPSSKSSTRTGGGVDSTMPTPRYEVAFAE